MQQEAVRRWLYHWAAVIRLPPRLPRGLNRTMKEEQMAGIVGVERKGREESGDW
jgi:hypothetical protein